MNSFVKNNAVMQHKILNGLADNLVKVFIPLIILKYSNNLLFCVLFLVLYSIFTTLLNLVLKKLFIFQPLLLILLHIIPLCILQFLISLMHSINIFLIVLYALLLALGQTLYSVPANNYFMFENKKNNAGKMQIGTNIGKIIMIIIGGYIISTSNILYLTIICLIASILYVLSIFPLFVIKDTYKQVLNNLYIDNTYKKEDVCDISKKEKYAYKIYHIAFGIYQATIDTILPIYLYVNNLEFEKIVLILALIEVIKIFMNMLSQKISSNKTFIVSIIISSILFIVSILLILLIKNNLLIFILSTILSSTFPLVFIPNLNTFCFKIKHTNNPHYYMTMRDVHIFSLRILIFLPILSKDMILSFVVGIVSMITICILNCFVIKKE